MLDMLKAGVNYILDLGAAAMLPIILTIFGVILGQKLSKSVSSRVNGWDWFYRIKSSDWLTIRFHRKILSGDD